MASKSEQGTIPPAESSGLAEDVRTILRASRNRAYAAANQFMVEAYWNIGRRIVEEEQKGRDRADYGSFLIRNLSKSLGDEFGGGVSVASLKNFRQFYLTFPDFGKSYAAPSLLTWTHWTLIMRVEDPRARDYYINEAQAQQWSSRILERNIAARTWDRLVAKPPATPSTALPSVSPTPGEFVARPCRYRSDRHACQDLRRPQTRRRYRPVAHPREADQQGTRAAGVRGPNPA